MRSRVAPAPCIVGRSPEIESALRSARQVARASGPALILGERGTGKELFARLIHAESSRAGKPLIVVNCATLNPALADAQLFGHVRGAFTGAVGTRVGFVGAAEGGTLFLDEVGELPLEVQARLLRLLQEGAVVAVGEDRERAVNVRVIAATNRDLHTMAREGRFREDLLDRLCVWELRLPALRERKADLRALAEEILKNEPDLAGRDLRLGRSGVAALRVHDWPGNVRELQRVILRAAALVKDGGSIQARQIRRVLCADAAPGSAPALCTEEHLLAALGAGEMVSMADLVRRTGLPRSTMKAAAARLITAGRLGRSGERRGTRYWRACGNDTTGPATRALHPLAQAAHQALSSGEPRSCQALAGALGVSPSTALRALGSLVQAGLVSRSGQAKATLYRVTSPATAASRAVEAPPPTVPAPPSPVRERHALDALALQLVEQTGTVARRELVRASGASERSALRALSRLETAGELARVGGRGCTTRYGLPGRPLPAPPARPPRVTPRRARPTQPRHPDQGGALALAVTLAFALQRGPIRPALLERHAGVPLEHARASLDTLAARGLLIPADGGYALAPPDRLLDDP